MTKVGPKAHSWWWDSNHAVPASLLRPPVSSLYPYCLPSRSVRRLYLLVSVQWWLCSLALNLAGLSVP